MKINKQTFDFIKSSLKQGIQTGKIINDLKISVSTLRKIKNVDSFKEYRGIKKNDSLNDKADRLIEFLEYKANRISEYKDRVEVLKQEYSDIFENKQTLTLRTIKNLLHLK